MKTWLNLDLFLGRDFAELIFLRHLSQSYFYFWETIIFLGKSKKDAENKEITIIKKFGRVFLDINAKHIKSWNVVKVKLLFSWEK